LFSVGLLLGACGSDTKGSDADPADAGAEDDDAETPDTSVTDLTGVLGALGDVQPIVSSFVISNSGETLIYLSSATLTCDVLMKEGGRWLPTLETGTQVVEIVVKGTPKLGTVSVDHVEINYAPGGKSSSYEKNAHAGQVTFTMSKVNGPVEGTVSATYTNPKGNVEGTFHAEFCPGGQEY
jgi:hypothetical protein